jgi:cytidylate kinase
MSKLTLSSYLRDEIDGIGKKSNPGPYVTISRQLGCNGYELGEILLKKLSERESDKPWKLYKKEILKQLAEETGLAEEILEKERHAKPSYIRDFFRGVRQSGAPGGYEIRNKITIMVRTIAYDGNVVIVGQGGSSATADLENGLSVRVEAPKEWRAVRVSRREGISKAVAEARIDEVDQQRALLRKLYEQKYTKKPAFDLALDNSAFNAEEIADLIILAMEKKLI